ncbi:MAG: pilin [Arhodomonas sp.]|nr:pilin [Arhodomonas sp.]
MITVAIVGILSAIALPAYNTYVVRAKVSEGLGLLSDRKAAIATFHASKGRLPATFEELGWPAATGKAHGGRYASFQHVFGLRKRHLGQRGVPGQGQRSARAGAPAPSKSPFGTMWTSDCTCR